MCKQKCNFIGGRVHYLKKMCAVNPVFTGGDFMWNKVLFLLFRWGVCCESRTENHVCCESINKGTNILYVGGGCESTHKRTCSDLWWVIIILKKLLLIMGGVKLSLKIYSIYGRRDCMCEGDIFYLWRLCIHA